MGIRIRACAVVLIVNYIIILEAVSPGLLYKHNKHGGLTTTHTQTPTTNMVIGLVVLTGFAVYAGAKHHQKKKQERRARREAAGDVAMQKGDQERQSKRRRRWHLLRQGSRRHKVADQATNHVAVIELPGSYEDDAPPPYVKPSNASVHSLPKQQLLPSA